MNVPHKIEMTANIATIFVAALLSVALVKVYFLSAAAPVPVPATQRIVSDAAVGVDLNGRLPGIDWHKNGRTLVLAISTTCHFCKDSEPFYRRLQQEVGKGVKMVAVLPQPVTVARQYLDGAGLHVDGIRQVSLFDIGVRERRRCSL